MNWDTMNVLQGTGFYESFVCESGYTGCAACFDSLKGTSSYESFVCESGHTRHAVCFNSLKGLFVTCP